MERELEEWYNLHKFNLYSGEYKTKDLAELLGVNPRTIQRWLKLKNQPTKEQLIQIALYLKRKQSKISL